MTQPKHYPPFRKQGHSLTDEERAQAKDAFLLAFSKTGNYGQSAIAAKVSRSTVDDWRRDDPEFAKRYQLAESDAADAIRGEITRRGITGWEEPVYQHGKKVGSVRKYSDQLLALLARARLPEFKEKLDVTTAGQPLGNYYAALIVNNPELSELAARLAEATSLDSSGISPDSQPEQ